MSTAPPVCSCVNLFTFWGNMITQKSSEILIRWDNSNTSYEYYHHIYKIIMHHLSHTIYVIIIGCIIGEYVQCAYYEVYDVYDSLSLVFTSRNENYVDMKIDQ